MSCTKEADTHTMVLEHLVKYWRLEQIRAEKKHVEATYQLNQAKEDLDDYNLELINEKKVLDTP